MGVLAALGVNGLVVGAIVVIQKKVFTRSLSITQSDMTVEKPEDQVVLE